MREVYSRWFFSADHGLGLRIEHVERNSKKCHRMCAIAADFELLPYFVLSRWNISIVTLLYLVRNGRRSSMTTPQCKALLDVLRRRTIHLAHISGKVNDSRWPQQ